MANITYAEEFVSGQMPMAKGKVCWWDKNLIKEEANDLLFVFDDAPFNTNNTSLLKERLLQILKDKGFVLLDEEHTVYRYSLRRNGRLKEFGVNYKYTSER